ncbi:T-cell-specific surface glycoprotein CD28 [Centroberyx affinis]|uniref:T-cell-specific surface glycoprotein CD28 n=1 Tax=Centroberyx affinis TaxID=166261 RepID=UPI003A5C0030
MSIGWISLLLLGVGFSHSELLGTCSCPDQLNLIYIPVGGCVFLPCPNPENADDVTFRLFLGQELIASHDVQNNTTKSAEKTVIKEGVELHRDTEDKSVKFVLTGVTTSSFGNYSCEATVTYPPPLRKELNASFILVLLEGQQYKCNAECNEPTCHPPLWIWIVLFAALSVYGVIVTVIACVSWLKLRRAESQSDYMNTKPRAPKGHRKKKGVHNLVPRHF